MNSKGSAQEGDSMPNQLMQSRSSTGEGDALRGSRGTDRGRLTLTERMNIQEEALKVLRQEMMNQFQQFHQILRVGQQLIIAATPGAQLTHQIIRTPNVETKVQGTTRATDDHLLCQGHGIKLPKQSDDVTHEGNGMKHHQREQSEQIPIARQERIVGKQSEQTAEPQLATKRTCSKWDSMKESDREDLLFFHRMNPSTFAGGDSVVAENWLHDMCKIFNFLDCSDAQRVHFVTYQLLDDAYQWWETKKQIFESQDIEITWSKFKEAFYEKFFPSNFWEEKAREFAELRQGTMSVTQYETKFFVLLRYAPNTALNDEVMRQKFEDGLADSIRGTVMSFRCQTYRQAVDQAMLAEKAFEEMLKILVKRKSLVEREESSSKRQEVQNFGQVSRYKGSKPKKLGKPPRKCDKCNRFHSGQCNYQQMACHKCGQMGHLARDCIVGYVCYQCGKAGHLSRDCQSSPASV